MPNDGHLMSLSGKTASAVIYLLAFALLGWAAVDLYQRYQSHSEWKNERSAETPAAASAPQTSNPKSTLSVARQHLFGEKKTAQQVETITRAPATRLKLKLIGVIASHTGGASKVIIQIENADIGVYSIGDKLPQGNAIIEKIEPTQVLLRRNGKLESLAIIRPELEDVSGDKGLETKD
ncbi:MAG: type II secretion system protein N, partial [Pseudomonadota bacterium]|nr:type II secretion system protein N [Pseudomonadota bacterium]